MGLRINQNIAAMNAYRNLSVNDSSMSKSLEKLSSGFRINRAADDAAGLSISEGLRAQTGGLKVAVRNAQDGISVVQTAEGALTETHSLLQRMRDLAVQAANTGGNDTDARTAIKTEVDQITNEINRIGNATKYGANNLLDGSNSSGFDFQIGSQSGLTNKLNINVSDMRAGALGLQGAGATLQGATTLGTGTTALATTDFGAVTLVNGNTTTAATVSFTSTADTKTAAGRVQYQWRLVDVNAVVARVVEAMRGTTAERGATIAVGDLPPVWADAAALEQVFANLIGNAVQYLDPARPGRIEVGSSEETVVGKPAGLQVYYVKDNGLGIPEAYHQRMFTAFNRLHVDVAQGEGIGLALVRRMVERHGGRIWLESAEGVGTTFFIALPACPAGGAGPDPLERPAAIPEPRGDCSP